LINSSSLDATGTERVINSDNSVTKSGSGVPSYGAFGHVPFKYWKFYAFCSCCQFNCEISKITKEKYILHFRPSR